MSSRGDAASAAWQRPFVSVFKNNSVKDCQKQGDVTQVMDKTIGKKVFRIHGSTAASNFLQIPNRMSDAFAGGRGRGLGLTGRFCYIQLRATPNKLFTFHIDVRTTDNMPIRLSFSSMFREAKFATNVIRIPVALGARWTMIALDLPDILAKFSGGAYGADAFSCVRGVTLGATLSVRGVFTSDELYDPGSLPREMALPTTADAQRNGGADDSWHGSYDWCWCPGVPHNAPPQPAAVAHPVATPGTPITGTPTQATKGKGTPASRRAAGARARARASPTPASVLASRGKRHFETSVLAALPAAGAHSARQPPPPPSPAPAGTGGGGGGGGTPLGRAAQVLQQLGKGSGALRERGTTPQRAPRPPSTYEYSRSRQALAQARSSNGKENGGGAAATIHSRRPGRSPTQRPRQAPGGKFANAPAPEPEPEPEPEPAAQAVRAEEEELLAERRATLEKANLIMRKSGIDPSTARANADADLASGDLDGALAIAAELGQEVSPAADANDAAAARLASVLHPDPIVSLDKVLGYDGTESNSVLWSGDGGSIVFPSRAIVVIQDVRTAEQRSGDDESGADEPAVTVTTPARQRFLLGHTDDVVSLTFNCDNTLLATGQTGDSPSIRLWHYASGRCLGVLQAHHSGLRGLSFSHDDRLLCGVGLDKKKRTQIIVWDISGIESGHAVLAARQVSEWPITRLRFSPYAPRELVSCGRENVRFWRIRHGHLPGRPASLNQYSRGAQLTDLAFEGTYGPPPAAASTEADGGAKSKALIAQQRVKPVVRRHVFVSTSKGLVLQIDYDALQLKGVFQLHDGPINCIAVNEGFCVTGADDKFLRVWPLDFSDYFLEAEHEGEVSSADVSVDGLKIAVGTRNGLIGVLDVATHGYSSVIRSHTAAIHSVDVNMQHNELCTVSSDGTIRIWGLDGVEQRFQFDVPDEVSRCVAYNPLPTEHAIACGFDGGSVRVFDIPSTQMKHEYQQHKEAVVDIVFSPDGKRMFSAGSDGHICMYDVARDYQPVKMISGDLPGDSVSLCVSPNGKYLAAIGPDVSHVLLFIATTMQPDKRLGLKRVDASFSDICFTADSEHVIAVTSDQRMVRFSAKSGKCLRTTPKVSHEPVRAIATSPNGQYLATGGTDRTLRIWDSKLRGPQPPAFQAFAGHASDIAAVQFTPDGKHVVSTGEDNAVLIWRFLGATSAPEPQALGEVADPAPVPAPAHETKAGGSDSVNVDSQWVKRFDPVSGPSWYHKTSARVSWTRPPDAPPDSDDAIEEEYESQVGLEDAGAAAGALPAKHATSSARLQFGSNPSIAAESEGSMQLAAVLGYDGAAHDNVEWNLEQGMLAYSCGSIVVLDDLASRRQSHCHGHSVDVSALAMSPSGDILASASGACDLSGRAPVCIWGTSDGTLHTELSCGENEQPTQAMAWDTDGRFLAVVGQEQASSVIVWDVQSSSDSCAAKVQIDEQDGPLMDVVGVTPLPSSQSGTFNFVTAGKSLVLWECQKGELSPVLTFDADPTCDFYTALAACEFGGDVTLAAATSNGAVEVWGLPTDADDEEEKLLLAWQAFESEIDQLAWRKSKLIVGCQANTVKTFDCGAASTSGPAPTVVHAQELDGPVTAMAWDEEGTEGIVGTSVGSLVFVNTSNNKVVPLMRSHQNLVAHAAFDSDGSLLATAGGDDCTLRIWHVPTAMQVVEFRVNHSCTCVAFEPRPSAESYMCAAGFADGSVRFFNLATMQMESKFYPHGSNEDARGITALAFAAKGAVLLTGTSSGETAFTRIAELFAEDVNPYEGRVATIKLDMKQHERQGSIDCLQVSMHDPMMWLASSSNGAVTVSRAEFKKLPCHNVEIDTFTRSAPGEDNEPTPTLAAFSPTEGSIVLCAHNIEPFEISLRCFTSHTVLRCIPLGRPVLSLSIAPNALSDTYVVVGSQAGMTIVPYDSASTADHEYRCGPGTGANDVQFSPNGDFLVSVGWRALCVWNTRD